MTLKIGDFVIQNSLIIRVELVELRDKPDQNTIKGTAINFVGYKHNSWYVESFAEKLTVNNFKELVLSYSNINYILSDPEIKKFISDAIHFLLKQKRI